MNIIIASAITLISGTVIPAKADGALGMGSGRGSAETSHSGIFYPDLPADAPAPARENRVLEGRFQPGRYRVTAADRAAYRAEIEILLYRDNDQTLHLTSRSGDEGRMPSLTGSWRVYMIPPHNTPTPPIPMLTLSLSQAGSAGDISGRWTAEPAFIGSQHSGAGGSLLTASLDAEGLLRITVGRTAGLPGEVLISMRPYETGFAGSMSAGRRGMRALLWRADRPIPPLLPLKEALHGPAQ